MKKHKIGAIASVGALALGAFAYISPAYADGPDCSAIDSRSDFQSCLDAGENITLAGDVEGHNSLTYNKPGTSLTVDMNGHNITNIWDSASSVMDIKAGTINFVGDGVIGSIEKNITPIRVYGSVDDADDSYTVVNIANSVSIEAANAYGLEVRATDTRAHGVIVNLSGSITANRGIFIDENIANYSNHPSINLTEGSSITANTGHAIVGCGYASWQILGATIEGVSGIGFQAGDFFVQDSNVTATGSNNPAPLHVTGGMMNSGAAIQYEALSDLVQNPIFYIIDSTFESKNGYALVEYAGDEGATDVTFDDFTIYTGAMKGTDAFENSVVASDTGAFFWYYGDGRMMAPGSHILEVDDLYDSHVVTVARFAQYVNGLEDIYTDPAYEGVEEIFPVFFPLTEATDYELEALAETPYRNSTLVNIFDIQLRMFEEGIGGPEPGFSRPFTIITNTGENHPITFIMSFPETEEVKDGYIREWYMLNFHQSETAVGEYDIEKIPIEFNIDGSSYAFSTHKFSTFALAYEDIEIPHVPDSGAVSPFTSVLPTLRFSASL